MSASGYVLLVVPPAGTAVHARTDCIHFGTRVINAESADFVAHVLQLPAAAVRVRDANGAAAEQGHAHVGLSRRCGPDGLFHFLAISHAASVPVTGRASWWLSPACVVLSDEQVQIQFARRSYDILKKQGGTFFCRPSCWFSCFLFIRCCT
jgi:hypothetical protein